MTTVTGDQIAAQARKYVGVPFRHCEHSEHGLDCVGLCVRVGHDLGLTDYVPVNYSQYVVPEVLRAELGRLLREIPAEEISPGCVCLMRVRADAYPFHVGIYTGQSFIHAFQSRGCVVEVSWGEYWTRRIEAVFSWEV